jgi:hypothetical protein
MGNIPGEGGVPMSALVPQATWQLPADVLALAAQLGVSASLDPLLEATRRIYPTARSIQVRAEQDPEIANDRYIVFEVCVPQEDISDYHQAQRRWTEELFRICPPVRSIPFCLFLIPVG